MKTASVYRMVMEDHVCPYGIKTVDLLKRQGFEVDDHHLTSREETDAFKDKHDVETTPQTFMEGKRIGGYDDVREFFGKSRSQPEEGETSYQPVIAIFAVALLLALGLSWAFLDDLARRPEASGRAQFLDHVPQLRSTRTALGALWLRLSVRRSRCRHSHDRGRTDLAFCPAGIIHRHRRRCQRLQGCLHRQA
jgi:glutaredoxin